MLGCSLSAALFHFSCVALYAYKVNSSANMPAWLNSYCSSFFYQDWKLFVPPPSNNYKLIVLLPNTKNIDVFAELQQAHRHNRLAGKGFELLAIVNYVHHFEKGTVLKSGNVSNDANFKLLQYACTMYVNQSMGSNYPTLPVILYVKPIGHFPAHSYFAY